MASFSKTKSNSKTKRPLRFGVVGLGHIAQVAVLPAFKAARRNSVLSALVTADPKKAQKLAKKYKVSSVYGYEQFDDMLRDEVVDALYICLPNHLHHEYTILALKAGIPVLCEKPLAVDEKQCREMIEASESAGVPLMTAYRLHFEEANLEALKMCRTGKLGDLRYFNASFSYQITDPANIRLQDETGGGPVEDIGIYCINAARTLFAAEPEQIFASSALRKSDKRFKEVPETVSVMMRFPDERFATFTCSFGSDTASRFELYGTKGALHLENAFEYVAPRTLIFQKDGQTKITKKYKKVDQFAPEILYFADCVQKGIAPEPDGEEGLRDIRVIQAIQKSISSDRPVELAPLEHRGPKPSMKKRIKGHSEPELVHARGASS